MFRDLLARDPRFSIPKCAQLRNPSCYKSASVTQLQINSLRIRSVDPRSHSGELGFERRDRSRDVGRIAVSHAAKLVCHAAIEFAFLSSKIVRVLQSRCQGFGDLFFESLQRVIDDVGMDDSFPQSTEELRFEFRASDQQCVRANSVAPLRVR